jgi:hypothetical protein
MYWKCGPQEKTYDLFCALILRRASCKTEAIGGSGSGFQVPIPILVSIPVA